MKKITIFIEFNLLSWLHSNMTIGCSESCCYTSYYYPDIVETLLTRKQQFSNFVQNLSFWGSWLCRLCNFYRIGAFFSSSWLFWAILGYIWNSRQIQYLLPHTEWLRQISRDLLINKKTDSSINKTMHIYPGFIVQF